MTIIVTYADLRSSPLLMQKFLVDWKQKITALEAVKNCLGENKAIEIENELQSDLRDIIVSWYHPPTDAICEIGGVDSLDWEVADETILSITYRNADTTEDQEDELIEWTRKQGL